MTNKKQIERLKESIKRELKLQKEITNYDNQYGNGRIDALEDVLKKIKELEDE